MFVLEHSGFHHRKEKYQKYLGGYISFEGPSQPRNDPSFLHFLELKMENLVSHKRFKSRIT